MSDIRRKAISGLTVGDTFEVSRTFSSDDAAAFAELSRDYNPVHFDERFTEAQGFDSLISHGLLVGSLLTEVGGQIGWLASKMSFSFKKPVYFGDTITCRFTLTSLDARQRAQADAVFSNQHGETVVEATVRGIVPGPKERLVMEHMVGEGDPTNPLWESE